MNRVLVTAFGPYGPWETNASWLALVELTQNLPVLPHITTRLYPVDYSAVREKLEQDLLSGYDCALHLGQAPGSASLHLESVGINVGVSANEHPDQHRALVDEAPVAYRTRLPLADWAAKLRGAEIPARVSYHAGTYLCNAVLYLSHYWVEQHSLNTRVGFIHLPLAPSQTAGGQEEMPTMPSPMAAEALRLIFEDLKG